MRRSFSSNGVIVFAFVVISLVALAVCVFLFVTGTPSKQPADLGSQNVLAVQTPKPSFVPTLYPACEGFWENKKWGLIDKTGNFVVKPKYDEIMDFQDNGYAVVTKYKFINGVYETSMDGLIDSNGLVVLPLKYSYIPDFSEGLCSLSVEGEKEITVINENLEKVFIISANSIGDFKDGIAVISRKNKDGVVLDGFIDKSGKVLLKPEYDYIDNVFGERAFINNEETGNFIIDLTGKKTLELNNYSETRYFGDGLITFQNTENAEKYGLMDMYGLVLIKPSYDDMDNFYDGFALVYNYIKGKEQIGLINSKGEVIIPLKEYRNMEIQNFGNSLLGIYKYISGAADDSYFAKNAFMNLSGKRLTEFRFYNVTKESDGIYSVSDGVYTFFVDRLGRELKNLPKVLGVGRISRIGDLYKCDVDGILSYVDNNAKLVWKENLIRKISKGINAKTEVFRNGYLGVARYPVFSGIDNHKVEKQINSQVKKLYIDSLISKQYPDKWSIELDYGAEVVGSVLTVRLFGYGNPIGGHGNSIDIETHLSLLDGKELDIKDLFKTGKDYESRLSKLFRNQALKEKKKYENPASITMSGKETLFNVTKNSLTVTFMPYEISFYGDGMPTF